MNRVSVSMILPVAVTMLVTLIIVSIGSLLLGIAESMGEAYGKENGELIAVAAALVIAGAILVGCALAARGGTEEHHTAHH